MRLAFSGLLSCLKRNATVVTPSRLLAATGYQQFALNRVRAGESSWERPDILSAGAWLTRSWQEARYSRADVPALLSPSQENLLWKRIVAESGVELFDVNATSRMASRAPALVSEWDVALETDLWNDHEDAAQFRRWLQSFRRLCKKEGWITRSELWRLLPVWLSERGSGQEEVVFVVADATAPAIERLVASSRGEYSVTRFDRPAPGKLVPGKAFETSTKEIEFAARWARAALEASASQSIGILVPDLAAHRAIVERAFNQVCYPGSSRNLLRANGEGDTVSAFHIHAGVPLASEPLVAGALLLLQLARPRIPIGEAGAILRSPWISGFSQERSQRASADIDLRKRRELDVSLKDLEFASLRCPSFGKIWQAVRQRLWNKPTVATFGAWSEFVGDLLGALGWPGEQDLSAREQELVDGWKDALSQLSALSLVSDSVSFDEALVQLRLLLNGSAKSDGLLAPIQILDAAQAPGLQFDSALLTGLSDGNWPPPVTASPLIPLKLQREYGIPGSSPASVRFERERITTALFAAAPRLLATWSGRLTPSAESFIQAESGEIRHWTGKLPLESYKPAILEEAEDSQAPRFLPGDVTRGGTSIIKSQSLCPFRAFAEFRLQANSPEEGCLGLDGRDRGGYLHKALQFVWQNLGSRDRLRAISPAERQSLVEAAISQAVRDDQSSPFHQVVTAVECKRLKTVIMDWLAVEQERLLPFQVQFVEEEKHFDLGGLRLRLRVDRIDRLPNGQLLLIDYKSGAQTRNKLKGVRPQEPQLLVYAAASGQEVDGVLFAELKPRESRPVGIAREKQFRNARSMDAMGSGWHDFLDESRSAVTRLAGEFLGGEAAVDPLSGACEYCAQKPFCRIQERGAREEDDE